MKTIFITGATGGIGLSTALLLQSKGYHVIVSARNSEKALALKAKIPSDIEIVSMDVRNYDEVKLAITGIIERHKTLDVLINNAGLGYFDPIAEGSIDQWHEMVDANVKGLLNCTHVVLPHLIASRGLIVNIGSVASRNVFANSGVYASTKHAVLAISESLRLELAGKIKVSTIMPGAVNTDFISRTDNEALLKDYVPYFASGLDPKTIAEAILYCVSAPEDAVISEITVRPDRKVK
jgi:3-hydroxy acid dehydrogenase/malonic semialdehyde reductase